MVSKTIYKKMIIILLNEWDIKQIEEYGFVKWGKYKISNIEEDGLGG